MPLLLLERLRLVEMARVHRQRERAPEPAKERARACDEAMLEHARPDRDVAGHFGFALGDRAYAVTGLQSNVPQHPDKPLDEGGARAIELCGKQDEDIDVGMGEELAAPVSAHGDERHPCGRRQIAPERCNRVIDRAIYDNGWDGNIAVTANANGTLNVQTGF